jgi:hypothetical protein
VGHVDPRLYGTWYQVGDMDNGRALSNDCLIYDPQNFGYSYSSSNAECIRQSWSSIIYNKTLEAHSIITSKAVLGNSWERQVTHINISTMERSYRRLGYKSPYLLLQTRWRWMVSFTHHSLPFTFRKHPPYPLNKRVSGLWQREKSLPGIKPSHPVTLLTELFLICWSVCL